jgi:hypothetical protein
MRWLVAAVATLALGEFQQTAPPDTEIFLATVAAAADGLAIARAVNVTNSPGYDNQPSFAPDGRSFFFTSSRGGSQTDIYRYDVASGTTTRITETPESEYSPTVTPDGAHLSVIRVEADGTQRLWQFTLDGRDPAVVLRDVKPVGYHVWTDRSTLVLFVLGPPATLRVADTRTGLADVVVTDIGRSLQRIPGRGTVSFVAREPSADGAARGASPGGAAREPSGGGAVPEPSRGGRAPEPTRGAAQPPSPGQAPSPGAARGSSAAGAARLIIRELDPRDRRVTTLVEAPAGAREADVAWMPDGTLLMAKDDVLYRWRRGESAWKAGTNLASLGMHGVSRIAVSSSGDQIAFVTQAQR